VEQLVDGRRLIEDFIRLWREGSLVEGCDRYLADEVRWLNSGQPACVGKLACVRLAERFTAVFPRVDTQVVALAVAADAVLVERVDRCIRADGTQGPAVEVTGSFRIKNGLITYWYDYFDPAAFVASG